MPYTNPGQAFDHTLVPLKGWYRDMALDAEVIIGANVNINSTNATPTPGLVVHTVSWRAGLSPYGGQSDGPGTFVVEMGCGPTHGMPMFLYSRPGDPDVSNPGVVPGVPVYGDTTQREVFGSVLPRLSNQNLVALVASGGYEVETTEFDTAQTYTAAQPLRSVTSNTNANAGKVTNERGPVTNGFGSAGAVQFVGNSATVTTWDTIVGFVSRGTYINANLKSVLGFYTYFVPGNR